jgi:prepilin signal peptidase PulO-like enzyme (type II secretory pathway)
MPERVLLSLAAAAVGFALSWLLALVSERLQEGDGVQSPVRGLLLRDPLAQGLSAAVWAAAPWLVQGEWWRWATTGVLALPLIQVGVTDLRFRYVYTVIAGIGVVLGLAFGWCLQDAAWWTSPVAAAAGGLIFLVVYLLGRLVYRGGEPVARGDITIAAMVGAVAATCVLKALVLGVVFSAVIALSVLVVRRSGRSFIPYGPGLCLGALVVLFWC